VVAAAVETKPAHLRLPYKGGTYREHALKNVRIMMVVHYYTTTSFTKKSGDGDAELI
jgi:hypothetical protein